MPDNILGIDTGGSAIHVASFNKNKMKCLFSFENDQFLKYGKNLSNAANKADVIALTGAGKNKFKIKTRTQIRFIDEIDSIGLGGASLSGKEKAFIVSMGTGTAMVMIDGGKTKHIGGTGLGGGTLKGLAKLIFKTSDLNRLETLARNGDLKKVDLRIIDVMGKNLGRIPAWATASNLGKIGSVKRADVFLGVFSMVAEVVGTLAFFVAKNYGLENDLVFCGRVAKNSIIKQKLKETVGMWGGKAEIPKNPEYCAAIGAAIHPVVEI